MIGEKICQYQDAIVHHVSETIRIPSVLGTPGENKPFGEGPDNALKYMLNLSAQLGFKAVDLDGYAGFAEYGEGIGNAAVIVHSGG